MTKRNDDVNALPEAGAAALLAIAGLLRELRATDRPIPIGAAEALVLIACGIDHINDLAAAMGDGSGGNGGPLPGATANRLVSLLRGRSRYDGGSWRHSPLRLVVTRPHPHRKGQQLLLSEEGAAVLNHHLGQYLCTSLLGASGSTGGEIAS